jgi:integrase
VKDTPLTASLAAALRKVGFFDVSETSERLEILLSYLERFKLSTAKRYFNQVKFSGLLGDTDIKHIVLSDAFFMNRKIEYRQKRIASPGQYEALLRYMYKYVQMDEKNVKFEKFSTNPTKNSKLRIAIVAFLFAVNSGLRRAEVLRLTNVHLQQLIAHEPELILRLKGSIDEWKVPYHPRFIALVKMMTILYEDYLKLTLTTTVPLFNLNNTYLRTMLIDCFRKANGIDPPIGFGFHSPRYYIASFVADSKNITSAQLILNHKSLKTTKRYIQYKHLKAQRQLAELEKNSDIFNDVNEIFASK